MSLLPVVPGDGRATPRAAVRALAHTCAGCLAFCSLALGIGIAARGACAEARQAEVRHSRLATLAPIMQSSGNESRTPRGHGACKARPAFRPAAPRS
ncbi:hypothetical protein [Acidovorax cavernicola]|uniref:Uncharacterized protein n=1 Tax=Acidovorax cavernicola TaxID=1675792 RepID=A0A9X8CZR7_9BURK|nr:hypothetical protein [Acidovorax cavernicola]RIX74195.1 hypothetical protein D3H34_27825 [Acidovorax cavernicola]